MADLPINYLTRNKQSRLKNLTNNKCLAGVFVIIYTQTPHVNTLSMDTSTIELHALW